MSSSILGLSLRTIAPRSILGDGAVEAAIDAVDPQIEDVSRSIREASILPRVDELPEHVIDLLAWQFHCDFYEPIPLPLAVKRALVKESIPWHRKKGTLRAIKRLLSTLGYEGIEIIERPEAARAHTDGGGLRLDGSWRIGGLGAALTDPSAALGMPHIAHWATFAVKHNLAEAVRPTWKREVTWAVETAKPLRSSPFYWYWIIFDILVSVRHDYSFLLAKDLVQRYPWCSIKVDGTWRMGVDGASVALDSRLLDGSWRIGQLVAGSAERTLRSCNIIASAVLKKHMERPERHNLFRLEDYGTRLRLNSGWRLGKHGVFTLAEATMKKYLDQDAAPDWTLRESWKWELGYPFNPSRLTSLKSLEQGERLNRGWRLNTPVRRQALDGSWRVRKPEGIITEPAGAMLAKIAEGAVRSAPLGKTDRVRTLCGKWKLRPGTSLGRAPLLRVGGGWSVGRAMWPLSTDALIRKQVDLAGKPEGEVAAAEAWDLQFPATPRPLGGLRRLDGPRLDGWKLNTVRGSDRRLGGSWKIGLDALGCETAASEVLAFDMSVVRKPLTWKSERIGSSWTRRIDGGWIVGAARRVSGAWNVANNSPVSLAAPKIGARYRRVDGSWIIGARARKLNGAWRIGDAGAETSAEIVIRKRG